jgi:hypothetical protein
LNLYIAFGSISIFLVCCWSTNMRGTFIVFIIEVFHLLKFISTYLFFEATVNGIVFMISLPDCSLLVYRKATYIYRIISK